MNETKKEIDSFLFLNLWIAGGPFYSTYCHLPWQSLYYCRLGRNRTSLNDDMKSFSFFYFIYIPYGDLLYYKPTHSRKFDFGLVNSSWILILCANLRDALTSTSQYFRLASDAWRSLVISLGNVRLTINDRPSLCNWHSDAITLFKDTAPLMSAAMGVLCSASFLLSYWSQQTFHNFVFSAATHRLLVLLSPNHLK